MNRRVIRAFWNPAFVGGLALLFVGSAPLLVFIVLQSYFGYAPGNNGLGFGLLFVFTAVPALALLVGGFVVAVKRLDGASDGGAA